MEEKIKLLIEQFENGDVSCEECLERIRPMVHREVSEYSLQNYWRSQNIEDFVAGLCISPIKDWKNIDDSHALVLINEILDNVCDDALIQKNLEALEKRYSKPEASDLFFQEDLSPEEILAKLKVDSVIRL